MINFSALSVGDLGLIPSNLSHLKIDAIYINFSHVAISFLQNRKKVVFFSKSISLLEILVNIYCVGK